MSLSPADGRGRRDLRLGVRARLHAGTPPPDGDRRATTSSWFDYPLGGGTRQKQHVIDRLRPTAQFLVAESPDEGRLVRDRATSRSSPATTRSRSPAKYGVWDDFWDARTVGGPARLGHGVGRRARADRDGTRESLRHRLGRDPQRKSARPRRCSRRCTRAASTRCTRGRTSKPFGLELCEIEDGEAARARRRARERDPLLRARTATCATRRFETNEASYPLDGETPTCASR